MAVAALILTFWETWPSALGADQRDQYLASAEVNWLTLQTGKGTDGASRP
jgi:hypothetical protein